MFNQSYTSCLPVDYPFRCRAIGQYDENELSQQIITHFAVAQS